MSRTMLSIVTISFLLVSQHQALPRTANGARQTTHRQIHYRYRGEMGQLKL